MLLNEQKINLYSKCKINLLDIFICRSKRNSFHVYIKNYYLNMILNFKLST